VFEVTRYPAKPNDCALSNDVLIIMNGSNLLPSAVNSRLIAHASGS
jgi:hypothetical protein